MSYKYLESTEQNHLLNLRPKLSQTSDQEHGCPPDFAFTWDVAAGIAAEITRDITGNLLGLGHMAHRQNCRGGRSA
jgi:hypothetical protein